MATSQTHDLYSIQVKRIDGEVIALDRYRGRVLLIVNVASQCVFTSQYAGLQLLHEKYAERGLSILGFPCNQFANQEPNSEEQIQSFCSLKYQVGFDMFSKVNVNGESTAPIYRYLKERAPGLLGFNGIKWNFTKFLIARSGNPVARYSPTTAPAQLEEAIRKALQEPVPASS